MMRKFHFLSLIFATSATLGNQAVEAQTPAREARVEARQERQEQRQAARMNNQAQYYNQQTWTQLDPWITRNNVTPLQRAANAATAAVGATERALTTGANVAANAAGAAANAATAATTGAVANANVNNTRFGYTNPSVATTPQGWFYDYYTYSPTYYSAPAANATAYGNAARFYDLNNDGVYDQLSNFSDSDKNGSYDVYDRYDFAETSKDKNNDGIPDSPSDASRHSVSGTVEATKVVKVNGAQNLVVRLAATGSNANQPAANQQNANQQTIVDLGASDRWPQGSIKEGAQITATGPIEQVGDKQVLVAESASIANQKVMTIARTGPKIEGQVVDVSQAQVKGAEHTMAIVDNGSTRQIVDLGPTDRLKFRVEPQTKISIQGVPVQFRNHSVVLAHQVDLNGQSVTIDRW